MCYKCPTEFEFWTAKGREGMPFQVYGTQVEFPYEPYPVQFVLMEKILRACENSQNALLESPTGTGKSLALLCAALAWQDKTKTKLQREKEEQEKIGKDKFASAVAKHKRKGGNEQLSGALREIQNVSCDMTARDSSRVKQESLSSDDDDFQPTNTNRIVVDNDPISCCSNEEISNSSDDHAETMTTPKIFYATRTHAQIDQIVQELRTTSYRPKMDILGSRNQYCIHKKVTKAQNRNEECKKLLEERSCPYAFGIEKIHDIKELSKVYAFSAVVSYAHAG